ncbi:MAG: hypothetical protein JKX73_04940 [Flavobacteriales bacterium]|nr:hypothetical protein [Flavobacteriales bacterium]
MSWKRTYRIILVMLLYGFFNSTNAQESPIFGKYCYKSEVGSANLKYSFFTEYRLELSTDSQYVLEKFIYHTSKPGLKSGFELVESSKHRGYWKVNDDLLLLRRISMLIEMKESSLIEPHWVELDIRGWTKKKGYFVLRRKPKG